MDNRKHDRATVGRCGKQGPRNFRGLCRYLRTMSNTIDQTIEQRGAQYGAFEHHATLAQSLKESMRAGANWNTMDDDMKEALEMVQHKIARIINGNPNYHDSWHDIIGYVRLIEQRLKP